MNWAGTEGLGVLTIDEIEEHTKKPFVSKQEAADFIIQQVLANPGIFNSLSI